MKYFYNYLINSYYLDVIGHYLVSLDCSIGAALGLSKKELAQVIATSK